MKFYAEYGNDAAEKGVLQRGSKKGEKLHTITVPESYIEDMVALMEPEHRAEMVGAWMRGDTEVTSGGKDQEVETL